LLQGCGCGYVQKQKLIIQQSEKRLNSIIKTAPDGIIVIDGNRVQGLAFIQAYLMPLAGHKGVCEIDYLAFSINIRKMVPPGKFFYPV
jgi:hypothetical protein